MSAKPEKKATVTQITDAAKKKVELAVPEGLLQDVASVINNGKATPTDVQVATNILSQSAAIKKARNAAVKVAETLAAVEDKANATETWPAITAVDPVKSSGAAIDGNAVFVQDRNRTTTYVSRDKLSEVGEMITQEQFVKMDHGVVVMNMLLKPCETYTNKADVTGKKNLFQFDPDDEFGQPFHHFGHVPGSNHLFKGKGIKDAPIEYDVYRFVLNNRPVALMMDRKSKVWIGENGAWSLPWELNKEDIPLNDPVAIMMRDSSAIDCNFFSQNVLVGVDVRECRIHDSTLVNYELDEDAAHRIHWNGRRKIRYHFNKKPFEREVYSGSEFIRCTLVNSEATTGEYFQTILEDSKVDVKGRATVHRCTIKESCVTAGDYMLLVNTNINQSSITATGKVLMQMPSLNDTNVRIDSIYARNKFAVSKFPVVCGDRHVEDYMLIRTSQSEVKLRIGYGESYTMTLGTNEWELRNGLREWLRINDTPQENEMKGSPDAPYSTIKQSIHKYIMDSVVSRIEVINMLDDATDIAASLDRDGNNVYNHKFKRGF